MDTKGAAAHREGGIYVEQNSPLRVLFMKTNGHCHADSKKYERAARATSVAGWTRLQAPPVASCGSIGEANSIAKGLAWRTGTSMRSHLPSRVN